MMNERGFDYEIEELLPIVADLSRRYTSGESTSISYEKAQQLMEAVLYCMGEAGRALEEKSTAQPADPLTFHQTAQQSEALASRLDAQQAYQLGYQQVQKKTEDTRLRYQKLMEIFEDYGNRNLHDTAVSGITGFFQYYDIKFAPQETILTMDYPTLNRDIGLAGIDAISAYVDALSTEQIFLGAMPKAYVCRVLQEFDPDYKKQFFNISTILARNLVGRMIVDGKILHGSVAGKKESAANKKPAEKMISGSEREELLWRFAAEQTQEALTELFLQALRSVVSVNYDRDEAEIILRYYSQDLKEFAAALKLVEDSRYVRNLVSGL